MNFYGKLKSFSRTARKNFYEAFFNLDEILEVVNRHILAIDGEISEINIAETNNGKTMSVTSKALMTVVNKSEVSVALINPKRLEQSEVKYFSISETQNVGKFTNLYSSTYSKSETESADSAEKIEAFAENNFVENLTISLEPKEKFSWDEEIRFEFHTADTKRIWQGVSWKEFRNNGDLFWFEFEYYLPEALMQSKPKILKFLPEDWQSAVDFPVACYKIKDIVGRKLSLEIKPIFIDLSKAKIET